MVFEHLFPDALLERKAWTGFVLAAIYSTIAIVIARLLFPANSGLVSVVFTSIFLLPYFSTLLKREELQEESDSMKSVWGLLRDNADVIKIYFSIFLGIYITYMLYTFLAPYLGYDVSRVFREQLSLEGVRGGAAFSFSTFGEIVVNNWWVLLACFLVSLVAGDGAIFFVAWNASTWGTIFGYRAMMAGQVNEMGALLSLLTIVIITFPHFILEGGAYILAAIAGGVVSDEIVERSDEVRSFVVYFLATAVVYVVAYLFLRMVTSSVLVRGVAAMALALGLLHAMQYLFPNARDQRVFRYNYYLFALAIGMFVLGAIVETLVLYNVDILNQVYLASRFAG